MEDTEHIDNQVTKYRIIVRDSNIKSRATTVHRLTDYNELRFAVMDMHRLRDHLNLNKYFKSFVPDRDGQAIKINLNLKG